MVEKQEVAGVAADAAALPGSAPSPSVSAVPAAPANAASRPYAKEFIRAALINAIGPMLNELGNPPLVDRIFPNGWRNAPTDGLTNLYDLCVRTFSKRGGDND